MCSDRLYADVHYVLSVMCPRMNDSYDRFDPMFKYHFTLFILTTKLHFVSITSGSWIVSHRCCAIVVPSPFRFLLLLFPYNFYFLLIHFYPYIYFYSPEFLWNLIFYVSFRSIFYNIVNYTQSESESIVFHVPLVDGVFPPKKKLTLTSARHRPHPLSRIASLCSGKMVCVRPFAPSSIHFTIFFSCRSRRSSRAQSVCVRVFHV